MESKLQTPSKELLDRAWEFEKLILSRDDILDPEGTHHVFASGLHGRKIDFDKISDDDPLYAQWVDLNADFINEHYYKLPAIVVGVANGTNRLASSVAHKLGEGTLSLSTAKSVSSEAGILLPSTAFELIHDSRPDLALVLEDVGTTGGSSLQVAEQVGRAGARNVEVLITWQRGKQVHALDAVGIPHNAIIGSQLPAYQPEECGYCQDGWLIA